MKTSACAYICVPTHVDIPTYPGTPHIKNKKERRVQTQCLDKEDGAHLASKGYCSRDVLTCQPVDVDGGRELAG